MSGRVVSDIQTRAEGMTTMTGKFIKKELKSPIQKSSSSLLLSIIFFFFELQTNIRIYESDQRIVTSRTSSPSILLETRLAFLVND